MMLRHFPLIRFHLGNQKISNTSKTLPQKYHCIWITNATRHLSMRLGNLTSSVSVSDIHLPDSCLIHFDHHTASRLKHSKLWRHTFNKQNTDNYSMLLFLTLWQSTHPIRIQTAPIFYALCLEPWELWAKFLAQPNVQCDLVKTI